MLVGACAAQEHRASLAVDFCYLRLGGYAITNIDRGEELEIHLGCQECPQTTQMGEQAGSEQTRHDSVFKLSGAAVNLVGVKWIDVPGGADEQCDVCFSESAGECDFIPQGGGTNHSFG